MKKELDEWKRKVDSSVVDSALSSLQMVIARPAALFDPYAAIATLEEVVNITRDKKDDRATRFQIVLRQCCLLVNSPNLQQILIKLMATKEEAEVAKVIAKATKEPASAYHGSFGGRMQRTPYSRRGTFNMKPPPLHVVGCVERWATSPVLAQRGADPDFHICSDILFLEVI